jgi:hypothetical protein
MEQIWPVVDAFKEYTTFYSNMGADYSVTDLLKPPRLLHLMRRHRHELPEQTVDEISESFAGSAVHNAFEFALRKVAMKRPGGREYIVEQRLWDKFLGRKISGKFDVWCNRELFDFKYTKTWKYVFGDYEDWEKQLNIYSYLAFLIGIETHTVANIMYFKNWDEHKLKTKNYPQEKIVVVKHQHWSREVQEKFLLGRVQSMIDAEDLADEDLPFCTDKERWIKAQKWAVMVPGKSSAVRLLDSEDRVDSYIEWREKNGKGLKDWYVEYRPGTYMRCAKYCPVRTWCNQVQQ